MQLEWAVAQREGAGGPGRGGGQVALGHLSVHLRGPDGLCRGGGGGRGTAEAARSVGAKEPTLEELAGAPCCLHHACSRREVPSTFYPAPGKISRTGKES